MKKIIDYLLEVTRYNAIRRLFRFVQVRKSEVVGLSLFAILFACLEGVGMGLILPILQYAENGQTAITDSSTGYWRYIAQALSYINLKPTLIVLLILAFVPIVLRNVVYYFKTWYSNVVSNDVMIRLRMKVVRAIYQADPEFYDRHPVGQVVGVVMSQTSVAGTAVLQIIYLLGIVMLMIVYVAILLIISAPLTGIALLFVIVVALVNKVVLKWIRENGLKNARLSQRLMAKIVERMSQMMLVKLRHTKKQEEQNIYETSVTMRNLNVALARIGATVEVIVDPILMLAAFVTLYIGITYLGSTLAQLGLLIFLLTRLNAKTKEFNTSLQGISTSAAGVKLVEEMYDAALLSNTIKSGDLQFQGVEKAVNLKEVCFSYPDVYAADGTLVSKGKEVLKNITCEIPAGSFSAFVGRSGAGKSTLVGLIPRLRDVSNGSIEYDSHSIKEFDIGSLRRGIGYVTQTPMLFNETILSNLTYGLDGEPSEGQIRRALEQAYATFVYDLPDGLNTHLGDRGVRFSGGERQRIALARVMLENPEILVLDEPTSALDSESEACIQRALSDLRGKKTIIVIAHRLATVMQADQLFVIDNGQIVERGTHEELISIHGAYATLFDNQINGFTGEN